MQTVDLERIKEKIRRLKSLAKDEAASVGEVANALAAAEKLCQEYNLILADIDENELNKELKESIIEKKVEVRHSRINAARSMNTMICKLYECTTFYNYDSTYQTIIGIESDIELALYAIDIAHSAMDLSWKKYMKSDEFEDYIADGFSRNQIRRDFNKGFAMQVMDLVRAMIADKEALEKMQESKCTALVIRKEAEITEYKNKNYPNLRSSRGSITTHLRGAVEAGRQEGSKVRFDKAINQTSTKITYRIGG